MILNWRDNEFANLFDHKGFKVQKIKSSNLWLISAAMLIAIAAVLGAEHFRARKAVADAEYARLAQSATNIEFALKNRIKSISTSMTNIAADLPSLVDGKGSGNPKLNNRLKVLADVLTGVRTMLIVGKDGAVYGASRPELLGMNFMDSDRFKVISKHADPQTLYLSEPFVTPFGTYTLSLGRAIFDSNGSFNGYVLAILDPAYFNELLSTARYAQGVSIEIGHTRGSLAFWLGTDTNQPEAPSKKADPAFLAHLKGGQTATLGQTDPKDGEPERLFFARNLDRSASHMDDSLVIFASRDAQAVYQQWANEGRTKFMLMVGSSALWLLAVWVYLRRRKAYEHLVQEKEQDKIVAQTKLKEVYELLTLAETSAKAGAWKWDMRSNELQWTDSLFRLFDLDPNGTEASFDVWQGVVHPEDVATAQARIEESVSNKQPLNSTYRILLQSGAVRWIDAFGQPSYDSQGAPTVFAGFCVDATKRIEAAGMIVESEARFRNLFEHLPIAYQSLDIEGRWLDANQKLADLLGFASPQQMIGQDFVSFWEEPYKSEFPSAFDEFKNTHNVEGEVQLRRRDGVVITVMLSGRIQRDSQGNFVRTHCIIVDISARRAMEEAMRNMNADLERKVTERTAELQEHRDHLERLVHERTRALAAAKDEAEHASKAKSVLLSNISHELRTPLNHIIGFNNTLKPEITSAKGKERMDKVMAASNRLLKMINNLLDAAMLETQQLQLRTTGFYLNELLDAVEENASVKLGSKGLAFQRELEVSAANNSQLHGDFQRLKQVLDELIDNAVKFASEGCINLRITQKHLGLNLVSLRFEIEDQGIGIPLESQASMFNLFVQEDGSSTRKYGGAGLGLALCQRIVNLMAGEIGISSEQGKGSQVWIEVPLSVAETNAKSASPNARISDEDREALEELLWLLVTADVDADLVWEEAEPKYGHLLGETGFELGKLIRNHDFAQAATLLSTKMKAETS